MKVAVSKTPEDEVEIAAFTGYIQNIDTRIDRVEVPDDLGSAYRPLESGNITISWSRQGPIEPQASAEAWERICHKRCRFRIVAEPIDE